MADQQTIDVEDVALALKPDLDADKAITVIQQKLDGPTQLYLKRFCKRHPTFAKDSKINRNHVALEVERFWPDRSPQAQKLWEHINHIVHAIPPAGVSSSVVLRIFVVSPQIARASLPQPKEAAVIAAFDSTQGILRSYVVPVFKELPSFDDMAIPAGLVIVCQSVPPMFNEFHDNRSVGMGAGADIYGARSVDKLLGGNDGEDEKFRTPALGMPWGMGGPPQLGVPPMGQTKQYDMPAAPESDDLEITGMEEAATAAAAAAELEHIVHQNAHQRHVREQQVRENEKKVHEAERREREKRNSEEPEQDKEPRESQGEKSEPAQGSKEEQPSAETTDLTELAKDSIIAEAEITSPEGQEQATGLMEGPTRPESMGTEIIAGSEEEAKKKSEPKELGRQENQGESVGQAESTLQAVEAVSEVHENAEEQALSAEPSSADVGEPAEAEQAIETADREIGEAERNEEEALDPTFISGASGSIDATEVSEGEAANEDNNNQEEVGPEDIKEAIDKMKEQFGDEEGGLLDEESYDSPALERAEGTAVSDEGIAVEAVSASPDSRRETSVEKTRDTDNSLSRRDKGASIDKRQDSENESQASLEHMIHAHDITHHGEHGGLESHGRSDTLPAASPSAHSSVHALHTDRITTDIEAGALANKRRALSAQMREGQKKSRENARDKGREGLTQTKEPSSHAVANDPFLSRHEQTESVSHVSSQIAEPLIHQGVEAVVVHKEPTPEWSAEKFMISPTPTSTSPHALYAGMDAPSVIGASVVRKKKGPSSRRNSAATSEARARTSRAQEWRSQRKEIKTASVQKTKKGRKSASARLNPEKLNTLTPDD